MKREKPERLVSIKVKPQTFFHLRKMAVIAGLKYPGMAVDKMVRSIQTGDIRTK